MVEFDPRLEVGDGEVLVGRVDLCVREREAEQKGVGAEDVAECLDDGDGAALADEHRFAWENAFQCALRGFSEIGMGITGVGFAVVADLDFDVHAGRAVFFEVSFELGEDGLWILVGDEAER